MNIRLRSLAAAITLVALSSRSPVVAQLNGSASFDCQKMEAPVEKMICSDPVLIKLDARLGEAYIARRDALSPTAAADFARSEHVWLTQRERHCVFPPKGDDTSVVECLITEYRTRLTELGAGDVDPPAPSPLPPGTIHPLCVAATVVALMNLGDPIPPPPPIVLPDCASRMAHIPVTQRDGYFESDTANGGYLGYFGYKPVGRLPNGNEAAIVFQNWGGTLTASAVVALRRRPDAGGRTTLLTSMIFAGGDRCGGGGIGAASVQGAEVIVEQEMTPLTFLTEAGAKSTHVQKLPRAANDCLGTLRVTVSAGRQPTPPQFATISADGFYALDHAGGGPAKCLAGLLHNGVDSFPHTYARVEMENVAKAFDAQCQ
jgi:uncharacterized protein